MMDHRNKVVLLFFGSLVCYALPSIVEGRLFVVAPEDSTGLMSFREAEQVCSSLHGRLATSAEFRHAMHKCFFPHCKTWQLNGGKVGTMLCSLLSSTFKVVAMDTDNFRDLYAFCIKERGFLCDDPPSFPNARLQKPSGDELLYTCLPGFVLPSGKQSFSLWCDSCGKWSGMGETCGKDESEGFVGGVEDDGLRGEKANGEVQGEEPGVTAVAATEASLVSLQSLFSNEHMVWIPVQAFLDKVTQRDSTVQSEESKEDDSQEINSSQKPIDLDDSHQESDHYDYHDTDEHDDHNSHHDAHHERDTPQDYGDHDDKPSTPAQHVQDRLNHPRNQDQNQDLNGDYYDHDDHNNSDDHGDPKDDDSYEYHGSHEGQKMWPGFTATVNPTLNSYREHAASTDSWSNDLTQQPFIDKDPATPVHESGAIMAEHPMHNLPGESRERDEMEEETEETVCTGENCPSPTSAGQSLKVAAITLCLVAIAVMVGVCCNRWQKKRSMSKTNGQNQSRPTEQIEMRDFRVFNSA